jgi:Uma2 family endonuclease
MVAVSASSIHGEPERRILFHGFDWDRYTALLELFGDSGPRVTYLRGAVELMSPSDFHEETKTILGRLLETYALEADIDLDGHGSTTFRKKAKERGIEADECYTVGRVGRVRKPDLAIEVVYTKPLIDKLEVYRGLGVREVWLCKGASVAIHVLRGARHQLVERSVVLPDLDLPLLLSFVRPGEKQTPLVRAYRAALRATLGK